MQFAGDPWPFAYWGYYPYWQPLLGVSVRIPHKCPICDGTGTRPAHFYEPMQQLEGTAINDYPVTCRACSGAGIVWELHG